MQSEGWQQALAVLEPLDAQLDAALAAGDVKAALRLTFQGASEAVRWVADAADSGARLHRVWVELTPLPLASNADGTLSEDRAYVSLAYQCWDVAEGEAERLARELASGAHCTNWSADSP